MEITNEADAMTAVGSDHPQDRKAAGQWLAENAEPRHRDALLLLLTDEFDTSVSIGTAWALLENPSEFTLSMVMRGLASADEETLEHLLFTVTPFLFKPSPPGELTEALDRCLVTTDHEIATGLKLAGLA